MITSDIPYLIQNWINSEEILSETNETVEKFNPATGKVLTRLVRSSKRDIEKAVYVAKQAQIIWGNLPAVQRGMILHELVLGMKRYQKEIAHIVALETGKSHKEALGETQGAIALGLFYASEGQRLYGKTTTSGAVNKFAMTVRCPVGVAGLIIAANTPIANMAWKIFPALICGNSAVLKAAEDTPATAWIVGKIAKEAGLPDGVLNIIQGLGEEAGMPLVEHPDVGVISFTGSTKVGRLIAAAVGNRMAKVSLELGGKNPLIVCDDADLDNAVKWTCLSAFSNAGQRCAAGSRIIVFDEVYEEFKFRFIKKAEEQKVGPTDSDDFGPVINERQLNNMLASIERAEAVGATVLTGGKQLTGVGFDGGYYLAPTILENVEPKAEISITELFGPITCLYKVQNYEQAIKMANDSPYGLTACIHTKNFDRAMEFTRRIQAGVAVVNAGTYGSEPHMPFGGYKNSGNGSREPGTEALDVYSELKDIYMIVDNQNL